MGTGDSILAWIESTAGDEGTRDAMLRIVEEEEDRALAQMELGAGFPDLVKVLQHRGAALATAICTRNSARALTAFDALLRASGFPPADELFPVRIARDHHSARLGRSLHEKPSPEPVHEIVHRWGLDRVYTPIVAHEDEPPVHEALLFVGDHVDDCLSGRRAGVPTGLVLYGAPRPTDGALASRVDATFEDLSNVADRLSRPT